MVYRQETATALIRTLLRKRTVRAACALICAVVFTATMHAQTFRVINNFAGSNGTNPISLTTDVAENMYGTTFYGGKYGTFGPGTVFKLTHYGASWVQTTLYNFYGHSDGGNPWGGVTFGPDGALYGTASNGGMYGYGVVYKLQPPAAGCKTALCPWVETVLYNFTGLDDGSDPQGNLVFDQAGTLYGTTLSGQSGSGSYGAAYKLSHSAGGWNITVLHTFTNGDDGASPSNGVIFDQSGNLYGTTSAGGNHSYGVVYELSYGASGWSETVLHSYAGGVDGQYGGGLAFDTHGNLFGFTGEGGSSGWGIIYELEPAGGGYSYNILYAFQPQLGGAPGNATVYPLLDGAGNIFGNGTSGGTGNAGITFELQRAEGHWNFLVLHNFNGLDGYEPGGNMVFDAAGNLYGMTENGGSGSFGVVYEITP